jgi:SAM-dependent methyltransferase
MDEAILHLRSTAEFETLVRDAYLGADVLASANRFADSGEFHEARLLAGSSLRGTVLDVGAGVGIASYAFAKAGATRVYALEPSASDLAGRGAIADLGGELPIVVLDAYAESIPLPDRSVDLVYARQVLHHTSDLNRAVGECARVLKPGGVFLACREHVVAGDADLRSFLASHPVEVLAGGENAYPLRSYIGAISASGLSLVRAFGPCDSLINAYPVATTAPELEQVPLLRLRSRIGRLADLAIGIPGIAAAIKHRLNRPIHGRLYTFLAQKDGVS